MGLDEALEFLLLEEGGWSNHPADTGGKTMYGVTQATYNAYRKATKKPQQTVRKITKAEAREVYDTMYWREARCDRLPWPISYLVFDAAVNSGPKRGIEWMQAGLGVKVDGQVGPNTIAAAEACVNGYDGEKMYKIVDARATFLARLVQNKPSQAAFLLGWWRRTLRVLARAFATWGDE
jgi:lysozyme family protein